MDSVSQHAIVIDAASGIKNSAWLDNGTRIDHGTGKYNCSLGNLSVATNDGSRMNQRHQPPSHCLQLKQFSVANPVASNGNQYTIEVRQFFQKSNRIAHNWPHTIVLDTRKSIVEELY